MKIFSAFRNSLCGIAWAVTHERAVRQESFMLFITAGILYFLPLSMKEKAVLLCSVLFVMVVELLNTGIEKAVDRISKEHHALAKIAKDTASAAVLFSIIIALILWGSFCYPILIQFLQESHFLPLEH